MTLRWLFLLLVLGGAGGLIWQTLPEAPAKVETGSTYIPFSLPDLSGQMQPLPKGEVVLLNFWATWCPPCRQEIPSMVKLHEQLSAKGLKIVAVSVDQRLDDLKTFVTEYKMPFQVLHDADAAISGQYGVFRYPESFLIDRNGVVQQHFIGAVDWMRAPIRSAIESMLAHPAVADGATRAASGS
ncbi:MAG: TlpA disulfide reductase family protein [Mariprofundus sp.]